MILLNTNPIMPDLNSLPIYLGLAVFFILRIYVDILKPLFDKKTQQSLDIERKNKETVKFNAEEKRWNDMFDIQRKSIDTLTQLTNNVTSLINKDINNVTFQIAKTIISITFHNSSNNLKDRIRQVFHFNSRLDSNRKEHIMSIINNSLERDFDETYQMLSTIFYKGVSLATYMDSIECGHKENFRKLLFKLIFDSVNSNTERLLNDIINTIHDDFEAHISEALKFFSK